MTTTATNTHILVKLMKPNTQSIWTKAQAMFCMKEGNIRAFGVSCGEVIS